MDLVVRNHATGLGGRYLVTLHKRSSPDRLRWHRFKVGSGRRTVIDQEIGVLFGKACAADLLAQAEHDVLAKPVLITDSARLAEAVNKEVQSRREHLDRGAIAKASTEDQGCIAVVANMDEALDLANVFGPEHMCLMMKNPWDYLGSVRNAGAIFLGEFSHEVLGDYVAGPSHVMPTAGTARFNSGLGVHSFLKFSPIVAISDSTSREISKAASIIGRAEGLTAHAEAAEIREELRD